MYLYTSYILIETDRLYCHIIIDTIKSALTMIRLFFIETLLLKYENCLCRNLDLNQKKRMKILFNTQEVLRLFLVTSRVELLIRYQKILFIVIFKLPLLVIA